MIIGVGTNKNFNVFWQSPNKPSPTITTAPQKDCGGGWLLISMKKRNDIGGARRLIIDTNDVSPTIMAGGIGSVNRSQYEVIHENGGFSSTKPIQSNP